MNVVADVVIVGAGIAGASLAYEFARTHRVLLLERENRPGYHSSGRSAAMLIASYGTDAVRGLTRASRPFFEAPPEGFSGTPLLSRRGYLHIARQDQVARLDAFRDDSAAIVPSLERLDRDQVVAIAPLIDPSYVTVGLYEPDAMAIDDAALHQGYLKGFARRGGTLMTDAEVRKVEALANGGWAVVTKAGLFEAPILVNAAGAWADELASLASVGPIGLQPKRRTAVLLDPPDIAGPPVGDWPMVGDIDNAFYVKPEGGALMVSPADETPTPPADAQPEELDVAIAVDRFERLTGSSVKSIRKRWAGLRSFLPDHNPVVGFDPEASGFFWLAGQGGFGFMTAPGAASLASALIEGGAPSGDLQSLSAELAPARWRRT